MSSYTGSFDPRDTLAPLAAALAVERARAAPPQGWRASEAVRKAYTLARLAGTRSDDILLTPALDALCDAVATLPTREAREPDAGAATTVTEGDIWIVIREACMKTWKHADEYRHDYESVSARIDAHAAEASSKVCAALSRAQRGEP